MNKTYRYMLPALYLNKQNFIFLSSIEGSIVEAYIANDGTVSKEGIFVLIDKDLADSVTLEVMLNSEIPLSVQHNDDNTVLVELPHKQPDLTEKFLKGEYSKMYPKEVALYRFPYPSAAVLTKQPKYKEYMEAKYGVSIEDGAELDSIPNLEDETFYARSNNNSRSIKNSA